MRTLLFFFAFIATNFAGAENPRFRFHLLKEPTTLSPFVQTSSASLYFLAQLNCPLQKIDSQGRLQDAAARCKQKSPQKVVCDLNPDLRFQNGKQVEAKHYLATFQKFLDPKAPSPRAEILYPIQNAQDVLLGKKSLSQLGIRTHKHQLIFELQEPDSEFRYTLANPLLTALWSVDIPDPQEAKKWISCGPYQIEEWKVGKKIVLKPNPQDNRAHPQRPWLEALFIYEDAMAVQAYQKDELDFLRRLPTAFYPKLKNSAELHRYPQIRFDAIFLSSDLKDRDRIGRALAQSISFESWRNLYDSPPRPGCFGIPDSWTEGLICWNEALLEAKKSLQLEGKKESTPELRLAYSKQGGDDHDRSMEFLQNEWQKNLGLRVLLEPKENRIFLEELREKKISFFRKGLSPERPTCLSVLKSFSQNSVENYSGFTDKDFEALLKQLQKKPQSKKLCRQGVEILRDRGLLIPTGPIQFLTLLKPGWQGLELNQLNHLDLSQLHRRN